MKKKEIRASKMIRHRSATGEIWHYFIRNKGAVVGLIVLSIIVITAIVGYFTIDYESIIAINSKQRLLSPCAGHPFGTDQYGRDIFKRVIYGARYSLSVGIVSVLVALAVGGVLGLIAGFSSGVVENVIMRGCDVFASIPQLLMAICISTVRKAWYAKYMAAFEAAAECVLETANGQANGQVEP